MDLYNRIKFQIENKSCPVHHKFPVANILYDNVMLTCCCTDFETDCYNEIIDILQGKVVKKPEVTDQPVEHSQEFENTAHAG